MDGPGQSHRNCVDFVTNTKMIPMFLGGMYFSCFRYAISSVFFIDHDLPTVKAEMVMS